MPESSTQLSVLLRPNNPIGALKDPLAFQYTPTIEYSHDVKYDAYQLTHTNYQPNAFARSENPTINITARFSAHTTNHFAHSEYALRFLRTYSKMNYGRQDKQKGQPPRILRFYAYGSMIFNNVPVVISKFGMTFPEDVDYIMGVYDSAGNLKSTFSTGSRSAPRDVGRPTNSDAAGGDGSEHTPNPRGGDVQEMPIWLPSLFTINISLIVQQNSYQTVTTFDLEKFSQGALYNLGYI